MQNIKNRMFLLYRYFLLIITLSFFISLKILAYPSYIGYSGAPGTVGTCAGTCHGSSGGTITVEGFPTTYVPGQPYQVNVKYIGGSRIANFNASVRIGTENSTAGTITAGLNTAIYSTSQEPNGVHFSTSSRDSGIFTWTAPDPGVGEVRLYLAGMQSTSSNGPNTVITLVANDGSGLSESGSQISLKLSLELKPNVIDKLLQLNISVPNKSDAHLRIIEQTGRIITSFKISDSDSRTQTIIWEPINDKGKRLPAGIYFALLENNKERIIRKFTIKGR